MSVEKSYASYSAQRDDTAVVRAPCLLTIRDRISILARSMARSLLLWVSIVKIIFSSFTRSRGAKCVLGRLRGTSDWVVRDVGQPLVLGSDASWSLHLVAAVGARSRQERSADDEATSQQGDAFGVPLYADLSWRFSSSTLRRSWLLLSNCDGSARHLGLASLSVPSCLCRGASSTLVRA